MSDLTVPFNLDLLIPTPKDLVGVPQVTSLDILEGSTKNFHPLGLFSTQIFGQVGDKKRKTRYGYIDIKIPILHPIIFRTLTKLRSLYIDIIQGKVFAKWDDDIKDFVRVSPLDGETGFTFFLSKWKDIEFEKRPSISREQNIQLINKYKNNALMNKIIVMPAALRDIEYNDNGTMSQDEINTSYRKLISLSNSIPSKIVEGSEKSLDGIRTLLQSTVNDIYDQIEKLVEGKKKLFMDKFAARRIFNGTRNVATAMDTTSPEIGSLGSVSFNDTVVGLYQYLKTILPVARFSIRNGFLSKVFLSVNSPVALVNKDTLKKELVILKPEYYDMWMTDEGIEKIISSFAEPSIRHKPIEINGKYIGLIYKGPDRTFKLFQDIDELPPNLDKKNVTPITLCELLYIAVYKDSSKYPAFVTRYPITGYGSIYPSYVFLKPTVNVEERIPLDDNWNQMTEEYRTYNFPITGEDFINSMSPHSSKMAGLGLDYDGDYIV